MRVLFPQHALRRDSSVWQAVGRHTDESLSKAWVTNGRRLGKGTGCRAASRSKLYLRRRRVAH